MSPAILDKVTIIMMFTKISPELQIVENKLTRLRRCVSGVHFGKIQFGNIARGTTDPEIDSVTWIEFCNNMAPLANLATRWRHLYLIVAYLVTKWHNLHHQDASPHCLELPYWHYQLVLGWYFHQQSHIS